MKFDDTPNLSMKLVKPKSVYVVHLGKIMINTGSGDDISPLSFIVPCGSIDYPTFDHACATLFF